MLLLVALGLAAQLPNRDISPRSKPNDGRQFRDDDPLIEATTQSRTPRATKKKTMRMQTNYPKTATNETTTMTRDTIRANLGATTTRSVGQTIV
jgi:hypothetical protein